MTEKTENSNPPRPTGKNAEQDSEIAALKALVEQQGEMIAKLAAATAAPKPAANIGVIDNKEASKLVEAARSKKPKTYRALQDGTDLKQGFIRAGTVFSTTQPQGSWMELVED